MTPLKQANRHKPDEGVWGDCHRAAIASVLNLPLDDVPHFHDRGRPPAEAYAHVEEWLNTRGLTAINVIYPGSVPLCDLLMTVANSNDTRTTRLVYLLSGESRTGCDHVVVCCGREIAHDPSLTNAGIVGPCSDGYWWVTFFGSFLATAPRESGVPSS